MRRWESEGVKVLPPELPNAVGAAFERLGAQATRDVIALFSILGGMVDMDDGYLRLWSLREMQEDDVNATHSEFGPVFADYLVSCWCYRLRPVTEETSAVYVDYFDRRQPKLVASSLAEFLATYERDPGAVDAW
jgi:hypothetical protein